MEKFLDSKKSSLMKTYRRGIELFSKWYGKTVEEILNERKSDITPKPNENIVDAKFRAERFEKKLEKFHTHLLKTYALNTARIYCTGVLQLFRYYAMGITLRRGSPISETQPALGDFVLKPEHVRKMFHVCKDLRSKLMVSMANDLGWRIGDFLSVKVGELPDWEQKPPIEWIRITEKEKVASKTCLSKDTVDLLKDYLFTFGLKSDSYLFFRNGEHISQKTVNRRLRDLAEDAQINLGNKKLRFHCFRKMIISEAKNLRIDSDIINLMVGKSVDKSMLPYLSGIDVKKAFETLQTVTRINGAVLTQKKEEVFEGLKKDMEKTKEAMLGLEKENSTLKTRIDLLQDNTTELNDEIKKLQTHMDSLNEALVEGPYMVMRRKTPSGKETYTLIESEKLDKKTFLKYIEGKRKPKPKRN